MSFAIHHDADAHIDDPEKPDHADELDDPETLLSPSCQKSQMMSWERGDGQHTPARRRHHGFERAGK